MLVLGREAPGQRREPRVRHRRVRGPGRRAAGLGRDRATRSSSASASAPARRGSGASSTSASSRPKPGWTSGRSASRRAATRARSPSLGCTTAGTRNRSLRVLALDGDAPPRDAELTHEGKAVGRVTSAVSDPETGVVALAYVRTDVPEDAALELDGLDRAPARWRRSLRRPALDWGVPRRSSGDRALPCGGRGRKFESCRAHRDAASRRAVEKVSRCLPLARRATVGLRPAAAATAARCIAAGR